MIKQMIFILTFYFFDLIFQPLNLLENINYFLHFANFFQFRLFSRKKIKSEKLSRKWSKFFTQIV